MPSPPGWILSLTVTIHLGILASFGDQCLYLGNGKQIFVFIFLSWQFIFPVDITVFPGNGRIASYLGMFQSLTGRQVCGGFRRLHGVCQFDCSWAQCHLLSQSLFDWNVETCNWGQNLQVHCSGNENLDLDDAQCGE